jgi:hypothetical protein
MRLLGFVSGFDEDGALAGSDSNYDTALGYEKSVNNSL